MRTFPPLPLVVLVFCIVVSRIAGLVAAADKNIICFGDVPEAWASTHSFRGSGRLLFVPEIAFLSLTQLCGFDQLFNLECAADGKSVVALKTRARHTAEHFAQMGPEVQMGPVPYGTYLAEAELVEQVQQYCLERCMCFEQWKALALVGVRQAESRSKELMDGMKGGWDRTGPRMNPGRREGGGCGAGSRQRKCWLEDGSGGRGWFDVGRAAGRSERADGGL